MFAVLITPAIPSHLRGYISRFLMEPSPNIFVGSASRSVIERLWERVKSASTTERVMIIYSSAETEQGFVMKIHSDKDVKVVDQDGIFLVSHIVESARNGTSTR